MNNLLICLLFIISCSPDHVTEAELKKIITDEKNGVKKTIERNGVKVVATYKPTELIAMNEIKTRKSNDAKKIDSILSGYRHNYFFILSFSIDGKSLLTQADPSISDALLKKLNYGLKENILVTFNSSEKTDSIPLMDYMYNSTFGMSNSDDILISFSNEKLKEVDNFTIHIKDLSVPGETEKITFKTNDIQKLPRIKI